jgi:predicted RNA binding protein with dsRBD fold (UPF0201 family)
MDDVYRVDVRVTAPVRDTEVPDRVVDAITNSFANADVEREAGRVVATTHSVSRFAEQLREQAILDTAREQLHAGISGSTIRFRLKKQAAFQGIINFSVGAPDELGDVEVSIDVAHPDVEAFVDMVAPRTKDGEIIDE